MEERTFLTKLGCLDLGHVHLPAEYSRTRKRPERLGATWSKYRYDAVLVSSELGKAQASLGLRV